MEYADDALEPKKIRQILPANGWRAYFTDHDYTEEIIKEVAMWALFEDGTVSGLVGNFPGHRNSLVPADNLDQSKMIGNFSEYSEPDGEPDKLRVDEGADVPEAIRQVLPANGWRARYAAEDGSEFIKPLVVWALHEDGTFHGLVANDLLYPTPVVADDLASGHFLEYVPSFVSDGG